MDRAYIDANHLVDRYVQGKLSDTELEEFEIYMLEHPEIVDDIEFAKGMQSSMSSAGKELFAGDRIAVSQSMLGSPYALAATVLLALSLSFSGYQYLKIEELENEIAHSGSPASIGHEYYLETVRGESDFTIEQQKRRAVIIRADVGVAEAESWSVELRSEELGVIWKQDGLKAQEHLVSILLGKVPTGKFTLQIFAEPSGTLSAAYMLNILEPKR